MPEQRMRAVRLVVFVFVALTGAAARGGAQGVAERLDALLARLPQANAVGLVVADAESGTVLYEHQADTPLKPASVQKLFVTAAALERLGPGFEYQTRVYLQGTELWVVGAGDPAIGDERIADRHNQNPDHAFDEWAAAVRARGVTSLSGIVLDDSVFDEQWVHPDWPDGQADTWYQAPVGGLNLNDNCVDVTLAVRGGRIEAKSQPELPADFLRNDLKLAKRQHPVLRRRASGDGLELTGTAAKGGALSPVCVRRPSAFFGAALKEAFEKRGIQVQGSVACRRLPADALARATLVATYRTPLPDVLWRANRFSQNLFAECLLKSLGVYGADGRATGDAGGSWDSGRAVLLETLGRMGVDMSGAAIRDGSGLSHRNRVTAAQITRLLVLMHRHRHADVFLASLAEAGELGSMRHRYSDPALRGRLRGKTGSIEGVRGLAGYLTRPDGTVLAFALLMNTEAGADLPVQACRAMLEGGGAR